jgi:hypothetical protein
MNCTESEWYVDRWVQEYKDNGHRVIQQREAYFDYTAALGGSYAALSLAGPPSVSSPASLVRPHLHLGMVHVAGWRRSFVGWTRRRIVHRRSR